MSRYLYFILICIAFVSCSKSNGPNSGYCQWKVKGEKMKAGSDALFSNEMSAHFSDKKNAFILQCTSNDDQGITITISDTTMPELKSGTYLLKDTRVGSVFYGNVGEYKDCHKSFLNAYLTNASHTGQIKLSIDFNKKRVSGTFSFDAVYEQSSEEARITEGKFSLPIK